MRVCETWQFNRPGETVNLKIEERDDGAFSAHRVNGERTIPRKPMKFAERGQAMSWINRRTKELEAMGFRQVDYTCSPVAPSTHPATASAQ